MCRLGELLSLRKEKIDPSITPFSKIQPISIHFDGSISKRVLDENREYSMDMYVAKPGDLVLSKIDLKNGAVSFVPEGWEAVAVTSHFAVYQLDSSRMLPAFLHRLIQTDMFKSYLWSNKVGAEGRTEVKINFFESIQIPVPPLATQQAIVAQWQALQSQAEQAALAATQHEEKGRQDFLQALGLQAPEVQLKRRAFAMRWSDMGRWGSESNRLSQQGGGMTKLSYPLAQGVDCIQSVSHGCSVSPSALPTSLEVLKISAVTRGWLNTSEKKFAPDQARLRNQYALRTGDVLLCRTNGTLDYVGRGALVEDDYSDLIFPDKVIRVRLKNNMLPAYFWHLLDTPYLRAQIESFARTAVGNYAIGGKDIWKFSFPLPPLDIQQTLVTAIGQARAEAATLRQQANQLRAQARRQIEAALLGQDGTAAAG